MVGNDHHFQINLQLLGADIMFIDVSMPYWKCLIVRFKVQQV